MRAPAYLHYNKTERNADYEELFLLVVKTLNLLILSWFTDDRFHHSKPSSGLSILSKTPPTTTENWEYLAVVITLKFIEQLTVLCIASLIRSFFSLMLSKMQFLLNVSLVWADSPLFTNQRSWTSCCQTKLELRNSSTSGRPRKELTTHWLRHYSTSNWNRERKKTAKPRENWVWIGSNIRPWTVNPNDRDLLWTRWLEQIESETGGKYE